MDYPKSVRKAALDAVNENADATAAVAAAKDKIRALPECGALVEQFFHVAVQELVYEQRHAANVEMRRSNGSFNTTPMKQDLSGVAADYDSIYTYRIAGTNLGTIRGDRLTAIAESELERANGHRFNFLFCTYLSTVVPADKTVEQAMHEKKLRKEFKRILAESKAG